MPPEEDTTLELRDYFRVLRRRKWIIAFTLIVCVGAALAIAMTQTPVYTAATRVLLQRSFVEQLFVPNEDVSTQDLERQRANEIQIMSSPDVHATWRSSSGASRSLRASARSAAATSS